MPSVCTDIQLLQPDLLADHAKFEELMVKADSGCVFASLFENKAGVDRANTALGQSTIYAIWAYRQCAQQVIQP